MRQEQLPVRARSACRKHAEHLQPESDTHHRPEVPCVQSTSGKRPDEVDEQDLHGANPANGRGLDLERIRVVRLEETERRDVAPAIDDDQVSRERLRPRLETAVGRRRRRNRRGHIGRRRVQRRIVVEAWLLRGVRVLAEILLFRRWQRVLNVR